MNPICVHILNASRLGALAPKTLVPSPSIARPLVTGVVIGIAIAAIFVRFM